MCQHIWLPLHLDWAAPPFPLLGSFPEDFPSGTHVPGTVNKQEHRVTLLPQILGNPNESR